LISSQTHATQKTCLHAEPALGDRPSIAVLPFDNLSGDSQQDCFSDGIVEEIITALSRTSWLFVTARNSSFIYKGRVVDVKRVGRELGVHYVLQGSVRLTSRRCASPPSWKPAGVNSRVQTCDMRRRSRQRCL
jgi:TolB-like protein